MPLLQYTVAAWLIAIGMIYIILVIYHLYENFNALSNEEYENINEIVTDFHQNPNYDDFIYVYKNRNKLNKHRSIKYWIWGVYLQHPDYFDEDRTRIVEDSIRDIERGLRRIRTRPTAELMDCIWAIYFATGDTQYPAIIQEIALNCQDRTIARAAEWSYRSVMGTPVQPTAEAGPDT